MCFSRGSCNLNTLLWEGVGFSYQSLETIVTSAATLHHHFKENTPIAAFTEFGQTIPLELVDHSPPSANNFAVLRAEHEMPEGRGFLTPKIGMPERGTELIFAGFPDSARDLFTHNAMIAAFAIDTGFYLDK